MELLNQTRSVSGYKRWKKVMLTVFVGLLFGIVGLQVASAQSYPDKSIRAIFPFSPGSAVDNLGRALVQRLSVALGQPVVVVNVPGASGQIGTEKAAKSAPDGYTLLIGYTSTMAINPNVAAKLTYDVLKDFAHIALFANTPYMIVVNSAVPATNLKELIELAKARPGEFNFGSSGIGSTPHLAGELFKSVAKIDIMHVPYSSGAPGVVALTAGETEIRITSITSVLPLIRAGKLRAIAVTSPNRSPELPDVPTANESGLPGFEISSFVGMLAPAKTPEPIIRRLYKEIAKIVESPDMKEFIVNQGAEPMLMDPEHFRAYNEAEIVKWAEAAKSAKMKKN